MPKGYKAGIKIDKTNREFTYNQLIFPTESEARDYVRDVEFTFDLLLFTHIVATTENPNYTYVDGKMEPINA